MNRDRKIVVAGSGCTLSALVFVWFIGTLISLASLALPATVIYLLLKNFG